MDPHFAVHVVLKIELSLPCRAAVGCLSYISCCRFEEIGTVFCINLCHCLLLTPLEVRRKSDTSNGPFSKEHSLIFGPCSCEYGAADMQSMVKSTHGTIRWR